MTHDFVDSRWNVVWEGGGGGEERKLYGIYSTKYFGGGEEEFNILAATADLILSKVSPFGVCTSLPQTNFGCTLFSTSDPL